MTGETERARYLSAKAPSTWLVKFTGNMTISIVDQATQEQVLKVDMLKHRTMPAGDGGFRLARTVNDLGLLASLPLVLAGADFPPLKQPDAGSSPGPWSIVFNDQKYVIEVQTPENSLAKRTFPANRKDFYASCRLTLQQGLCLLNQHIRSI